MRNYTKKNSKKIIIKIVILILFIISLIFIIFKFTNKENNTTNGDISNNNEMVQIYNEENTTNTINSDENSNKYIDTNPIKLGIYTKKSNFSLIKDTYTCSFYPEDIMGIFYVFFTDEESILNKSFSNAFNLYYNNYENISDYKIGYNISFELDTGEIINQRILNPDDAYLMYPKVQFYLYDDLRPSTPYYHLTAQTFNKDNLCTTIKLVGDKLTPTITSNIKLTAFTYKDDNDFNKDTLEYIGNSSYTIYIENEEK